MAPVRIHKGAISEGHDPDEVPREEWGQLLRARRMFVGTKIPHDCRRLLQYVEDARRMYEPMGFASVEDFVARGLQIDPSLVGWAVRGLRSLEPSDEALTKPIPLAVAVEAGKRVADVLRAAEPTKAPGAPKGNKNRAKNNVDSVKVDSAVKGGNRADYLAGRIKAKAALDPKAAEVVAKVERGEYTSMRAAARDAGVLAPPDLVRLGARGVAKVPTHRLAELVAALEEQQARLLFACLRDRFGH